jgi:hypothetical protein
MHGSLRASSVLAILAALSLSIAGCGPPQTQEKAQTEKPQGAASEDSSYQAGDLSVKIGDYMPPLEGGKLEIASPEGWDWARPGGDYLVGFVPHGSELNSLPRILVSGEDSPYPSVSQVTADNLKEFAQTVSDSIAGEEIAESVRPLILGENAFACHVTYAKRKNAVVSRQILETVVAGRRYAVRLEVYERQFDKHRDAAYAVAMSMKFSASGDSPSPVAEAPEVEDPAGDVSTDAEGED